MEDSLVICRELGDRHGESTNLMSLGTIFRNQEDADKALIFYQDSLALKQALNDELGEAEVKASIGGLYLDQGRKNEAVATLEESFKILQQLRSPLSGKVSRWLAEAKEER